MSICTSRWTCPRFMFVPRKPHTMGNEYSSICCGLSEIIFTIDMVERKDALRERDQPEYHENGKTGGLLLRLCESIFHTGNVVILDSIFCVLTVFTVLKKMGIHDLVLIKKRIY